MSKVEGIEENREALREDLWPDSAEKIWKGAREKGYFPSPRSLPLILRLIKSNKQVCGKLDPSDVYLDLLHRDMGQGVVEIHDEQENAYYAGYQSSRAIRSWQERVHALENAGFIRVYPKGNRKIGYIVIPNPIHVVIQLRGEGKVDDRLWQLFLERQRQVGARIDTRPASDKVVKMVPGSRSKRTVTAARDRRG